MSRKGAIHLDDDVRTVLENADIGNGMLHIRETLDHALYERVKKVIEALGGKWRRRLKAHEFPAQAADDLAAALANGHAVDRKKAFEAFYTPDHVASDNASKIVEHLGRDDIKILEPNAGEGALIKPLPPAAKILAIELDPRKIPILRAIRSTHPGLRVVNADFTTSDTFAITDRADLKFDAASLNPPFANNADVRHVTTALKHIRRGGILVGIMSPHWTFAGDRTSREFRDFLGTVDHDVEKLPSGTFASAGTQVETVRLTVRP